ncbi:MAG: DUF4250 domain-containing protein [Muribaculaceae bacterium]|nr:DUF4250 domain-containing protein [Muribaculaceae bacterium]
MYLPKDPNMLYSVINMKLRDEYPSLSALCRGLDIDQANIVKPLADAGYHYDEATNRFV